MSGAYLESPPELLRLLHKTAIPSIPEAETVIAVRRSRIRFDPEMLAEDVLPRVQRAEPAATLRCYELNVEPARKPPKHFPESWPAITAVVRNVLGLGSVPLDELSVNDMSHGLRTARRVCTLPQIDWCLSDEDRGHNLGLQKACAPNFFPLLSADCNSVILACTACNFQGWSITFFKLDDQLPWRKGTRFFFLDSAS